MEFIESLRASKRKIGMVVPIFVDAHGEIIDGFHRHMADKTWPKLRLEHVKTEKDKIIIRLILNVCRRSVPAKEKTEILERLGEILLEEGVPPGEISKRIAEETGMSYTWVMKYLPDRFKDDSQSARASSATRRVAKMRKLLEFLKPPREMLISVSRYRNTDRLFVTIEKPLYARFMEVAENLGTTLEILIQRALEEKLREFAALSGEDMEILRQALSRTRYRDDLFIFDRF